MNQKLQSSVTTLVLSLLMVAVFASWIFNAEVKWLILMVIKVGSFCSLILTDISPSFFVLFPIIYRYFVKHILWGLMMLILITLCISEYYWVINYTFNHSTQVHILEYKLTRVNSIPHEGPWWILYILANILVADALCWSTHPRTSTIQMQHLLYLTTYIRCV